MKITVTVPITYKVQGTSDSPRTIAIASKRVVDIPEVAPSDMPLALTLPGDDSLFYPETKESTTFYAHDGRLFLRAGLYFRTQQGRVEDNWPPLQGTTGDGRTCRVTDRALEGTPLLVEEETWYPWRYGAMQWWTNGQVRKVPTRGVIDTNAADVEAALAEFVKRDVRAVRGQMFVAARTPRIAIGNAWSPLPCDPFVAANDRTSRFMFRADDATDAIDMLAEQLEKQTPRFMHREKAQARIAMLKRVRWTEELRAMLPISGSVILADTISCRTCFDTAKALSVASRRVTDKWRELRRMIETPTADEIEGLRRVDTAVDLIDTMREELGRIAPVDTATASVETAVAVYRRLHEPNIRLVLNERLRAEQQEDEAALAM